MQGHDIHCCRRARTRGWAVGSVTFALFAALVPKCPICIAAWLGVLGLSGLAALVDPRVLWLGTALAAAVCSALIIHRFFSSKEMRS